MTTHHLTLVFFTRVIFDQPLSFSVFPIEDKLKGHHFDTVEVIEAESQSVLKTHSTRLLGYI
jgi:hypothetical protein